MQTTDQLDPQPLLAQVRETFADFTMISTHVAQNEPQANIVGNVAEADFEANMSRTMAEVVRDYSARSEDGPVVLLRYTASDNGALRAVLDSGRQVPSEDKLIQFTVSTSVADAGRVSVRSEMLTAAHRSAFDSPNEEPVPSKPLPGKTIPGQTPPTRNPDGPADAADM